MLGQIFFNMFGVEKEIGILLCLYEKIPISGNYVLKLETRGWYLVIFPSFLKPRFPRSVKMKFYLYLCVLCARPQCCLNETDFPALFHIPTPC